MNKRMWEVVGYVRRKAVTERYCTVVLAADEAEAIELVVKYWKNKGYEISLVSHTEIDMGNIGVLGARRDWELKNEDLG